MEDAVVSFLKKNNEIRNQKIITSLISGKDDKIFFVKVHLNDFYFAVFQNKERIEKRTKEKEGSFNWISNYPGKSK